MHLCFVKINATTKMKFIQLHTNPKCSVRPLEGFIDCGASYAVE
ncbi:hypothetical protein SAMN05428988_2018 [Chitinophaga sp. YR573]|nr:hypothetical protein SAMN05428988_2018 [Chitinophaga sp. YR573]